MRSTLILLGSLVISVLFKGLSALAQELEPFQSRLINSSELTQLQTLLPQDQAIIVDQSFLTHWSLAAGPAYLVTTQTEQPTLHLYIIQNKKIVQAVPKSEDLSHHFVNLEAVVFTELDFDGQVDFYTLTRHQVDQLAEPQPVVTFYVQTSELNFALDEALSQEVTERQPETVAAVEAIIRDEPLYIP